MKYSNTRSPRRMLAPARALLVRCALANSALLVAGCTSMGASDPQQWIRDTLSAPDSRTDAQDEQPAGASTEVQGPASELTGQPRRELSRVPVLAPAADQPSIPALSTVRPDTGPIDVAIAPLVLPEFIDVVFGEMLGLPYTTGAGIAERRDVVQLRSSGVMDGDDFLSLVSTALQDYGIRIIFEEGAYRILQDQELMSRRPVFIRSRAQLSTPADLRPVVQFVEVNALNAGTMVNLVRQALGQGDSNLKLESDQSQNFVIISGLPAEVAEAVQLVAELDELRYADSQIMRYAPVFWAANELSEELVRLLSAEGWQVSDRLAAPRPILILPIAPTNDMFIFARPPGALERVDFWLSQLDRPSSRGEDDEFFIYTARNVDAELMATSLGQLLDGSRRGRQVQQASAGAGAEGAASTGLSEQPGPGRGNVSVDRLGNRIIFSGTASEYNQVLPLLRQLDQAPAEVLIEVTIAEISLTDSQSSGVQFVVDGLGSGSWSGSVSSQGLGLGSGGLDVRLLSGDVDLAINAFRDSSRINVLSRPRLMARSGGSANIQVGSDVPVITSQRAAPAQGGGGALDVLQTVEYRKTGVLLEIEPIVFGNNRVELVLTQEVSTALPTTTADIASPTISNRSLNTTLSLYDGETVVLGGLITENYTRGRRQIPGLGDLPVLGALFSARSKSLDRTELVLFITAYIVNGPEDRRSFVDQFQAGFAEDAFPPEISPQ